MTRWRKLWVPSPALVIACIALVIALGGSAYALVVTGKQIKDGSVTSSDIKDGSLLSTDVKDGSLASTDIKNGSLVEQDFKAGDAPEGAKGDPGQKGDPGPAGAKGEQGPPGPTGGPLLPKVNGTITVSGASGGTGPVYSGGFSGAGPVCPPGGGGAGGCAGATTLTDFLVTRPVDGLSPKLIKLVALGTHIPTVDVVFPTLSYKLEESIVASESMNNSEPSTETVTFNYARITFTSEGTSWCWDRVTRSAC